MSVASSHLSSADSSIPFVAPFLTRRTARIGLVGHPRSGKNTVADIVCEEGPGNIQLAVSTALREEVATNFGMLFDEFVALPKDEANIHLSLHLSRSTEYVGALLNSDVCYKDPDPSSFVNRPRSPRWHLQCWGTEYRRTHYGQDYWINRLMSDLARAEAQAPRSILVTDVRFLNEIHALRERGFSIARVDRPGAEPTFNHYSEVEWPTVEPDIVISNNGSMDDLRKVVNGLYVFSSKSPE